jgi:hypothetical protein
MDNGLATTKALEGEYIAAGESEAKQDEVYGQAAHEEMLRMQREHNYEMSLMVERAAYGVGAF